MDTFGWMTMRGPRLAALMAILTGVATYRFVSGSPATTTPALYVDPQVCASCHPKIWQTYKQTGMGRSFAEPSSETVGTGTFYHEASDSYFTMFERDGKFFQRRHQVDRTGRQINVLEKQIDYLMGSGNHARTYLHRTARGTLIELPLGWYADAGGHWAMNPGYDRPAHDGFRRKISYECMVCHNAYPKTPVGSDRVGAEPAYLEPLPLGIDCQRCHGPGSQHVSAAQRRAATAVIRATIVNPARLSRERREEVCIQCHLESTSFPLPNSLPRYDRGVFGYRPGQPLSTSWLFFDHAGQAGRGDKFELVNAVYRMWKSPCFLRSKGAMECRTCHNPHDVPRGEAAIRHYDAACRGCHGQEFNRAVVERRHPDARNCAKCHMPRRRTEDVVHAVATDHLIQRRPPAGDLVAQRAERHEAGEHAYRGEVVLQYPAKLAPTAENSLYLALAQVIDGSNLAKGIPRLELELKKSPNARAEFYLALAEAWWQTGRIDKAVPLYREAVRRDARPVFALQKLGSALRHTGEFDESLAVLERAVRLDRRSATLWHEVGLTLAAQMKTSEAIAALEQAISLDPDLPEPHNNLGSVLLTSGQRNRALSAFREAIRIQPDYADAHHNAGTLLAGIGDLEDARTHFEASLRSRPEDARTRYEFAMALGRARQYDEAQQQLKHAVRIDPQFPDARLLLGRVLVVTGQRTEAIEHLRKAAAAADPSIREAAAALLEQMNVR